MEKSKCHPGRFVTPNTNDKGRRGLPATVVSRKGNDVLVQFKDYARQTYHPSELHDREG